MDLIRTAATGIGDLLAAADLWPVLVFAWAFGLLLLQLTVLSVLVSSLSGRLSRVSRHLRELSKIVERQTRVIQQLGKSQKDDLAPPLRAFPPAEGAEQRIPDIVQSAEGPVDLHEQLKALREALLEETSKKD